MLLVPKLDRAWPKKWNCNWELLNQNNRRKYWFYHSAVKFPWSEERKILSQRFRRSKITFETQEQRQSLIVLHWDLSNYINFPPNLLFLHSLYMLARNRFRYCHFSEFCFNPFSTSVPLLYPLKTSENLQFSVFRGHKSGTLVENGLK